MMTLIKRSILFRLFIVLILTTGIMGGILAAFSYNDAIRKMQADLDYSVQNILRYGEQSYGVPLWDFNVPHINKLNGALALNRMIIAVQVRSLSQFISGVQKKDFMANGTALAPLTEPYRMPPENQDNGLKIVSGKIIHNDEHIGTIDLIYTDYFMKQDIRKQAGMILLVVIGLTLVVAGITFVILQRSIIRPITRLSRISQKIATEQDYSLRVDKLSGDEIGILYDGFNYMLDNITARERELSESRNYILEIINSVADPIFVKDRWHRWVMINDALCALMGIERGSIIGKTDHDIFRKKEADIFREKDELIFSSGHENINEEEITDARGHVHTIVAKSALYTNAKGEKFIVGVIRDITANKLAEAEKKALEEQLSQARKIESIGQLAGGVAHDFNNMLGVIIGCADIALSEMKTHDPARTYLQEIMKVAERSASLAKQLLAFARKQPMSPKVLDLNETMAGILKMLQRLIGESIELVWSPGQETWPVLMDPGQLDQILTNLCVNARDAIAGNGKITIGLENMTLDRACRFKNQGDVVGDFVCLSVTDTGCGMDRETLSKIFEPFFTTKGVGRGTGLGLSTVYGIVKQNNGFIEAASEPGHGATFRIFLPRHRETEKPVPQAGTPALIIRGGETILLVEDEDSMLKMTTLMLQKLGYNLIVASDPMEALRKFKEHADTIQLLLTDMVMPGMNGISLAREVALIRPDVKVLFMSAYTADAIEEQGLGDQHLRLISKPFTMKDLAAKITEVLAEG
jgi:PAS domain S-box-containing protein